MVDPYRTPPARPDPWNRRYACTQNAPSCGEVPPAIMLAEVLREQAVLQRRLLRLGRVMVAAAVVLSALPWVLIGLGPWPSSQAACRVVVEQGPTEQLEAPLRPIPPAPAVPESRIEHAFWSRPGAASTRVVRATARANEELLRAYERPEVTVHRVSISAREAGRVLHNSDLRTRILPVEIKGGQGLRLLRLPASGWLKGMGLEEGDTLVRFNGRRLSNPDLALEAYDEAQRAHHAVFELLRDGKSHVLSVTWDA